MCSRLFKGNEQEFRIGSRVPVVGPKGAGRAVFDGFARVESLKRIWLPKGAVFIDIHADGFEEYNGRSMKLPRGRVLRGIGLPGTQLFKLLTQKPTPKNYALLQHHRMPVIARPKYPLGRVGRQQLQKLEGK